jgi:hypothetical protein
VHVHVLADFIALQHRAHGVVQVDIAVGHREAHHLHRLAQSREVLLEPEAVQLTVALVPVGAQALEHVGGVEHRRAVHREYGLVAGKESTVHPELEVRHVMVLAGGWGVENAGDSSASAGGCEADLTALR